MRIKHYIVSVALAMLSVACAHESRLQLPAIISDGMVIQQNSNMTFWGRALPGAYVTIHTDWDITVTATASPDSVWSVSFPTKAADNKPHQIAISTSDTAIVINDILLGEVWLASGQDNMRMPLLGWGLDTIANSAKYIAEANDKYLRMFDMDRRISWRKEFEIRGEWKPTTPENAEMFGAAAYFFAKTLRDSLNVPVGIINNSVGSTPCEAWVSDDMLKESVDFGHKVTDLNALANGMDQYVSWLRSLPYIKIPNNYDHERRLAAIDVNDEFVTLAMPQYDSWDEMNLPKYWDEDVLGDFDGIVWFVKEVAIPESWVGKNISVHLGAIDDCDKTYANGICIGEHNHSGEYAVQRAYNIPARYVKSTSVVIAVRVTDTGGEGGFAGTLDDKGMCLQQGSEVVSLEGPWKFRPAGEFYEDNLVLFDPVGDVFISRPTPSLFLTHRSPSALFYGMVYPISKYSISGIIWNQGEANVNHATQYRETFPLLIKSFRKAFNSPNLPFYFAQTSSWQYNHCDSTSLASIREAQRQVAAEVPNVAMFSTVDISEPRTPHPSHKDIEGQRFARLALHHNYGFKHITPSGPVLRDVNTLGQFLNLTFDNAEGLQISPVDYAAFEIAGEDERFFTASTVIHNNTISLFSYAVPNPLYVRYVYRNCSSGVIYNSEMLPAESFMTTPKLEN